MIVGDVMTSNIISIAPGATVEEAAKLMLARGISGLFVVDEAGDLVGIVTEGDLLRRDELGTERHRPWWLRLLVSPSRQAEEFVHANARHVRDVMVQDVISVSRDQPLSSVVSTMEQNRIKRVPVTENGRVVGVVSRSDLLRALVGRLRHSAPVKTSDSAIRKEIMDALGAKSWAPLTTLNVTVTEGVVDVWGTITSESERSAIRVTAENAPGAKQVHDHMVYVEPYTGTVVESPD